MSEKILFLDVDGVLNRCGMSNQGLETDKCDLLADLCRETGCKIVVSSTWRKSERWMERLNGMFASRDIECIGMTPDLTSTIDHSVILASVARHIEIREWLMKNPTVKRYAIVDDDTDADDGTGRYVRTSSYEGLTPEKTAELRRILQGIPCPQCGLLDDLIGSRVVALCKRPDCAYRCDNPQVTTTP